MSTLKVKQTRSRNGKDKSQAATLRSLGLRRIGQQGRGCGLASGPRVIAKVRHLVEVLRGCALHTKERIGLQS